MSPELIAKISKVRSSAVPQLLRFAVSTGLSASVTIGLPVLLHEFAGIRPSVAVAISQCSVLLLNFVMIRTFVFRSTRSHQVDFLYYAGSAAAFRGLEYVLFLLLYQFAGLFYVSALLCTLAVSTVAKFFWFRLLFAGAEPV